MKIHIAHKTEYPKVVDFYHAVIVDLRSVPNHTTWTIGVYPSDEYLTRLTESGQMLLGMDEGRIVAAMAMNGQADEAYRSAPWKVPAREDETAVVHLLAVRPALWGGRLGQEMLEFAARMAAAQGRKALRLDVMAENLPARRLYARCGFREIAPVRTYFESTGWRDFILGEKDLRD